MYYSKNKFFIREHLETTLAQLGYFYIANKSNKKKIKDYFHCLPFFFFDNEIQNIIYKILQKSQISSYIDKQSSFRVLCYNLYKDFCMNYQISYKSYSDFYGDFKFKTFSHDFYVKKERQSNIHTYILFVFIISLGGLYYLFSEKNI